MPTYLCHGFRWHRRSICYFVILQNVDDAAPAWIVAPESSVALLEQFYELFDFLPPCVPPTRKESLSAYPDHKRSLTNNSLSYSHDSYDSHVNEDQRGRNDDNNNNKKSKSRSLSRKRSKSLGRRPKTGKRDETPPLPSRPPPPPPLTPTPDKEVLFNDWSVVKFLEEFDPSNMSVVSAPWAYVADYVVRVDTSVSIAAEISGYEAQMKTERDKPMSGPSDETGRKVNTFGNKKAGWLEKLRDQLQRYESIRWYIVVCGDEERAVPEPEEKDEEEFASDKTIGKEPERSQQGQPTVVENGFEFRLPEFAGLAVPPMESVPSRRKVEKPLPVPENLSAVPPPPHPSQVAGKMPTENTLRPKSPNGPSGSLRRLFSKRNIDEPS
ncbi:hypothetical protein F4779DRAFT_233634 [Xylariaceae sp. FL0662B]|nr:hypothetical protein F4779DRAFT_233634 [Xylariaceae sp. FL0662B]